MLRQQCFYLTRGLVPSRVARPVGVKAAVFLSDAGLDANHLLWLG